MSILARAPAPTSAGCGRPPRAAGPKDHGGKGRYGATREVAPEIAEPGASEPRD